MLCRTVALVAGLAFLGAACDGDDGDGRSAEPTADAEVPPAEMPEPRTEVAGAAWNGRIVVVGGLTANGQASARADVYDPRSNEWSRLPDLPRPVHHTAVVAFDDRVWVIGGYTAFEGDIWVPLRTAFSLGEGEAAWRAEPEMREIRGALAAAVVRDRIIAGGGADGTSVLATTEVLRVGAGAWEPGPAMSQVREHFAMTAAGSDVYAIAGRAPGNFDSVEVLRFGRASAWEPAPALNHSRGGIGAATVSGEAACVAGGEEPAGTIAEVECFVEGRWDVIARLETPRHGLAVVALGDDLHVIGGGPQPGLTVSGVHEVIRLRFPRG